MNTSTVKEVARLFLAIYYSFN